MLSQPDFTKNQQRTYEQIGYRVKAIISDPKVQRLQVVTLYRLPNESPSDWRRLLNEMADTSGIRIERGEDGAYRVGWRDYCEG